jgi:hypothetical protein
MTMDWFNKKASAESAAKAIGKDEPHPFGACKKWVSEHDVDVDDTDAFCGKVKSILGTGEKKSSANRQIRTAADLDADMSPLEMKRLIDKLFSDEDKEQLAQLLLSPREPEPEPEPREPEPREPDVDPSGFPSWMAKHPGREFP